MMEFRIANCEFQMNRGNETSIESKKHSLKIIYIGNMELDVKKENVIEDKSYAFALKTVQLYRHLTERDNVREYILARQLLRSGTAIGSLVQESQEAESAKDFIHKLAIARKEARETTYWLHLLADSGYLDETTAAAYVSDAIELKRILAAIILTTKRKMAA